MKGTSYVKDSFVVLDCSQSLPTFGKVMMCLLDSTGAGYLLVSICKAVKIQHLGLYRISEVDEDNVKCVPVSELWDYCPLPGYLISSSQCIALKHGIFNDVSI